MEHDVGLVGDVADLAEGEPGHDERVVAHRIDPGTGARQALGQQLRVGGADLGSSVGQVTDGAGRDEPAPVSRRQASRMTGTESAPITLPSGPRNGA